MIEGYRAILLPLLPRQYWAKMKKWLSILTLTLSFICLSSNSGAEPLITDQEKADIARVEQYLNSLKSLRSKFVQLSSSGGFAEGNIYIKRPKKMRLEYTRPPHIQVYANGFWLTHVDTELGSVSRIPLKLTPATFLIRERVRLSEEVMVKRVTRDAKTLSLEIVQRDEPKAGRYVITLADRPLTLRKWVVTDTQGITTSVTLIAPEYNVTIPQNKFIFDEPVTEPEIQ